MTTRLKFKYDGPCKGKLRAEKQKKLLQLLKADLRTAKALHKLYRKTAVDAQEELKLQVQALQDELDEEKAYALDQLNDRAEAVADLLKRAAPEGWEIVSLRRDGWNCTVAHLSSVGADIWRWRVQVPGRTPQWGDCRTLADAVKAAEAVKIPKVKKAKKK
jgi:hypothetical protein